MNGLTFLAQASNYCDYTYDCSTGGSGSGIPPAVFAGMIIFMVLIAVAVYVVHAYFLGRIFKKAGVEAWKAWVPVYNSWVTLELGGQPGFWAILAFVPIVNIAAAVFMYIAMYHIGLRLGKEGVFVLLAIFLPIVWLIWLAVDHSTWNNEMPAAAPAANPAAPQPVGPQPTASTTEQPTDDDRSATPPSEQ